MPKFQVAVPQIVSYTEWSIYEVDADTEEEAIEKTSIQGSPVRYEDDTDYYYEASDEPPRVTELPIKMEIV